MLGHERWPRFRSCVAFKKELIRKIEPSQAALGEPKSVTIVVNEIAGLRTVRGNGAALLFEGLKIEADPEPARDLINLSRGRKRMSPDDILEQSELAPATLSLTCDLIRRLVVAVWIVSPADENGSGAYLLDALDNLVNRSLGLFAYTGDKAIWETEEEHILEFQPELRARLPCLRLAKKPKSVRRIGFAIRMRASAVADNDDLSSQSLSAGVGYQTAAGKTLVVRVRRDNDKRSIFELLTQGAEWKRTRRVQKFGGRHRHRSCAPTD
jgi:hypothetical protein